MTIAANIYCSPDDMADILSQSGINLRTDDTPPTTLGNVAVKAGNQIDRYCWSSYDPADLAQSLLVTDWAAAIACYFLCCRRGNGPPNGVAILYDQALVDLKEVQKGLTPIPGIPMRRGFAPVMSVMTVTQRPFPRSVVESSLGSTAAAPTHPVSYHQHRSAWERYGLNTSAFLDYAQ